MLNLNLIKILKNTIVEQSGSPGMYGYDEDQDYQSINTETGKVSSVLKFDKSELEKLDTYPTMGACEGWSRSVRGSLKNGELTVGTDLRKPIGHNFYISNDAANLFEKMERFKGSKFKTNIGGYRDYKTQWDIFDLEYCVSTGKSKKIKTNGSVTVAKPGTSNHGWGEAIDMGDASDQEWVKNNGSKFGWCHGEAPEEPWHFTFDLSYCKPS